MIRVGVVRGGISRQYDESLETGATVLQVLRDHYPATYKAVDILVTKDGVWHIAGRAVDSQQLADSVDVVWNALHGTYGEDGALQAQLEALGIPYTGSGPVASALSANPSHLKTKAEAFGMRSSKEFVIPDFRTQDEMFLEVYLKEQVQKVFLTFSPPWIVKASNGSSRVAKTRGELLDALREASQIPGSITIQEYVNGKPASVLLADQFRGQELYTFLPSGVSLSPEQKEIIQKHARAMYQELGLRHYAQIHFTVTPKHVYISHVTTAPHFTAQSHIHQSLQDVGAYLSDFIHHVIQLAIGGRE